ncbi:MAG TPA: vWA domain-containing protein, partial [Rubricoccaceae bacterium]
MSQPTPTGPSELVCILDRSGSMEPLRADAIGGFNVFLDAQKAVAGAARLSLVLFDHEVEVPHRQADLAGVPPLTPADYVPRGTTALYDAVGDALYRLHARIAETPAAQRPERVVVAILTDGHENASRRYTRVQIADAIAARRAEGWEFTFLAANQDAVLAAAEIGIAGEDAFS